MSPVQSAPKQEKTESIDRYAALTGYRKTSAVDDNSSLDEPLLPPEELESEQEEVSFDQLPWRHQPLARILIVFLGVFGVVFMAYLFLSPMKQLKRTVSEVEPEEQEEEEEDVQAFAEDDDPGKLKVAAALSQQERELSILDNGEPQRTRKSPAPVKTTYTPPSPSPRPVSPPPTVTRTVSRPPIPRPVSPRVSISQPPPPASRPVVPPEAATSDPTEAWLLAGQMGSYGQAPLPTESNEEAEQTAYNTPASSSLSQKSMGQQTSTPGAVLASYQAQQGQPIPSLLNPSERSSVLIGTQAEAVLEDAVVWDNSNTAAQQQFFLTLVEPLFAADQSVIFETGTQLVAQLHAPSGSGLVQLNVVAALVETSTGWQEVSLPDNVLLVRGREGDPLIAEQKGETSSGNKLDGMGLAVDVLSSAGEAFGIEGAQGASRVYDRVFGRSSQPAFSHSSQGVWVLEGGTEVEVFVNQTFDLPSVTPPPSPSTYSPSEEKLVSTAPVPLPPVVSQESDSFSVEQAILRSQERRVRHESAMQDYLHPGGV